MPGKCILFMLAFFSFYRIEAPAKRGQRQPNLLYSSNFLSNEGDELIVEMQARAPNTSWEIRGRECAVLQISIDGKYDQSVFLLHGEKSADYQFLIGPLTAGGHELEIVWDRSWARELDDRPAVAGLAFRKVNPSDAGLEPVLHAPILHLRKDTVGLFSDLPLLTYWETERGSDSTRITYTIIFSNEDGGTREDQLMARWGRTTDIEWCYSYVQGKSPWEEFFQARNHKELPFRGEHQGKHPILFDATQNNTFADSLADPAPVRVRIVPFPAALENAAREAIMDRYPWTYALAAFEMEREGKTENPADPLTERISDARNYVYIEVCAQQRGTELYFGIQLRNRSRIYSSDHGNPRSRIDHSGCFRSAVELPPGTKRDDLQSLQINCLPAPVPEGGMPVPSPNAEIRSLNRVFFLTSDYEPGPNLFGAKVNRRIKPGKSLTLDFPSRGRP